MREPVTLSATIGVVLPTIQIFHRFSLIGPLLTPPACAFFALLLPAYLLVTAIGCVWLPGGLWLARFLNPVTRGLIAVITWLGKLPFASVRVPFLPWYCVAAAAAALRFPRFLCRCRSGLRFTLRLFGFLEDFPFQGILNFFHLFGSRKNNTCKCSNVNRIPARITKKSS